MKDRDIQYLDKLKEEIVAKMKQSYPGIDSDISAWKGQDIVNFQEDLLEKVSEHISEKWFYTHMKSRSDSVPRVDVLNFLSRYVGYTDWNDFIYKNKDHFPELVEGVASERLKQWHKIAGLLILLILVIVLVKTLGNRSYNFSFADAYTKRGIRDTLTEIIILKENESPLYMNCDQWGNFLLKTKMKSVKFIVKAPYYKPDTIMRILDKIDAFEKIYLYPNDFAMMINYFSSTNVKDWKRRRSNLDRMISDSAYIYQVFDVDQTGMELYNKNEFIDKLTMPVNSLKDIEIMETIYSGNKISVLRFRQKTEE
ncbi:MAG: hypothetical protein U9N53_00765 [Bacteroidota bacterium]|nr:hypothetical protein [Bacteroidota bacterium]